MIEVVVEVRRKSAKELKGSDNAGPGTDYFPNLCNSFSHQEI